MSEPERPKRLSLSQIVEMLLTRPSRERSSVGLSRNPAGHTVIDVKVSAGDEETVIDAERQALEVYERLVALFPTAISDHETAEVSLTRNAKGDTQINVSAKTSDANPTLEALEVSTRKVYDTTRAKYPMADGRTARPGSVA